MSDLLEKRKIKIAFINAPGRNISEPRQFLNMARMASKESFVEKVEILDPNKGDVQPRLEKENFDVVGISVYRDDQSKNLIKEAARISPKAVIILGGPGATYSPQVFSQLFPSLIIIRWLGESVFSVLLKNKFDARSIPAELIEKKEANGSIIVKPCGSGQFSAEDNFKREPYYKVRDYDHSVVAAQIGCVGNCFFCSGRLTPVCYSRTDKIIEELKYLMIENKQRDILLGMANFTANPQKANEIIDAINKTPDLPWGKFTVPSRVDGMCRALELAPKTWEHFLQKNIVNVELGFETNNPKLLMELGKYLKLEEAQQHKPRLEKIIICPCFFQLDMMIFVPGAALDELMESFSYVLDILVSRKNATLTSARTIGNYLYVEPGTPIAEKYDNTWWEVKKGSREDQKSMLLLAVVDFGVNSMFGPLPEAAKLKGLFRGSSLEARQTMEKFIQAKNSYFINVIKQIQDTAAMLKQAGSIDEFFAFAPLESLAGKYYRHMKEQKPAVS